MITCHSASLLAPFGTRSRYRCLLPNALAKANVWRPDTPGGCRSRSPRPRILSIEFLVHAWDFAQATGQRVVVSDEVAQHVLGVANQIITPEARGGGAFADPLEAGPDAGILDRLVAFTGRAG